MKYTLSQIAEICSAQLVGKNQKVATVVIDSRNRVEGFEALFVAISGGNHDGHNYIKNMYNKGVRGFIVEREIDPAPYPDAGFVVCNSSLGALQSLAAHHRASFKGLVVAITGSNGKTITKEWIAQLAPAGMKVFRSPRSYNSQIGVALSLLMLEGDEQIAIIEAGISEVGEMERLHRMIRPEVGILTNIGDAHQENFKTIEQKVYEKLVLFGGCTKVIYGLLPESIVELIHQTVGSHAVYLGAQKGDYDLSQFSFHDEASQQDITLALAFYGAIGASVADLIPKLGQIQGVAMRLELKAGAEGSKIINDSYNSDINSLSIALDYLASVAAGGRKVVILSDILQSSLSGAELYGRVADMISLCGIDLFVGVGSEILRNRDLFSGGEAGAERIGVAERVIGSGVEDWGDTGFDLAGSDGTGSRVAACNSAQKETKLEFYASTEDFLGRFNKAEIRDATVLVKGGRAFGFEKISHGLELQSHTTVLEVNLDNMIHNLNYFRSLGGSSTQIMAMIKASGYGNGSFEVANMLQHQGVSYLAVAFADEGISLRKDGITMPIVVLNADDDSFAQMIAYSLEPEIYSLRSLELFTKTVLREGENNYPIHIKLDTGMHRLGFTESDTPSLVQQLQETDLVRVSTIFSHLAGSDEHHHDDFTRSQIERFKELSDSIIAAHPNHHILRHISNSAAIERFPEAKFDMVRLGIGLYGISAEHQENLLTVSTLKSRIVQIKDIPDGHTIGYGRHGHAKRIATLAVGYADGLNRHLSRGKWSVLVAGKKAPVVGNICMDTCMVDVTGIDVREGDSVEIFGSKETSITLMANALGTIPYEIMTGISARVKRIYIKEE